MAIVFATLIIKGAFDYSKVPDGIKNQVDETLTLLDCEHLIENAE